MNKLKRRAWTEEEEIVLLQLWEENVNDFRKCKRNAHIYQKIANELGGKFTGQEVHTKINNLQQRYRAEKKEMGPSGGSRPEWKHFGRIHKMIGSNAANNNVVEESLLFDSYAECHLLESPVESQLSTTWNIDRIELPSQERPVASSVDSDEASCSSARKRKKKNYQIEGIEVMKEQTEVFKQIHTESMCMFKEVVNECKQTNQELLQLFREQGQRDDQFLQLLVLE
ncbi:myb/SANT-like DNA-binding domain-containing protein 1 [Teleopsis dalmanni]|uniref:myb/SANT-like DNA-binding domain-containing protein 1 n=1 Tax=Teleopsis dalmanni TaxID=139649 RepID=UPI0018CD7A93|nr:myb/SANT-like DNA-binding domain-containing protein 1 [Teleopsis dalmanni]